MNFQVSSNKIITFGTFLWGLLFAPSSCFTWLPLWTGCALSIMCQVVSISVCACRTGMDCLIRQWRPSRTIVPRITFHWWPCKTSMRASHARNTWSTISQAFSSNQSIEGALWTSHRLLCSPYTIVPWRAVFAVKLTYAENKAESIVMDSWPMLHEGWISLSND